MNSSFICPLALLLAMPWAFSMAGSNPPPPPPDDRESEATRRALDRDGFCILPDRGPLEMSQAYRTGELPPFITSDSVLAEFHARLRSTLTVRDRTVGKRLEEDFRRAWGRLAAMPAGEAGADPADCHAAMTRARIVCGTVLRLLDRDWKADNAELAPVIAAEAARIEAATERTKPEWLGLPEPQFLAIDYTRFRADNFHPPTDRAEDAGPFRALRFLETVPFRLARKVELYSACYLVQALHVEKNDNALIGLLQQNMSLGEAGIPVLVLHAQGKEPSAPLRDMLGESMADPEETTDGDEPVRMNNLVAVKPIPIEEHDRRLIEPLFPVDAGVLERAVFPPQEETECLPDPLIAAAWFRDKAVFKELSPRYPGLRELLTNGVGQLSSDPREPYAFGELSPCAAYNGAMRALIAGPDPAAPDLFKSEAWRLKTRQTVLASWARSRSTFAHELIGGCGIGGPFPRIAGFVEPCPEFYQRLGIAARAMDNFCSRANQDGFDLYEQSWSDLAGLCARLEAMAHKQMRGLDWNEPECEFLGSYWSLMGNTDDQTRSAVVARSMRSNKVLVAASGHHRRIVVCYPWKGENILCEGAVLTFYSFPNDGPLGDVEWSKRLDANPPPESPDWLRPILAGP